MMDKNHDGGISRAEFRLAWKNNLIPVY
jgi:hypothetical protein